MRAESGAKGSERERVRGLSPVAERAWAVRKRGSGLGAHLARRSRAGEVR